LLKTFEISIIKCQTATNMHKKELKTMTMVVLEFSQTLLDLVQVT